jgi:hypothetical protein
MGKSLDLLPSRDEVRARYGVRLLAGAQATERGLVHHEGAEQRCLQCLEWGEVKRVLAAEVGEPQGVRTIVFDLVVDRRAGSFAVCRFDAEPGEDAVAVARAIEAALPGERLGASLKSLAADGVTCRWYPDLESLEEASLALLVDLED